jgi:hypothetical protein
MLAVEEWFLSVMHFASVDEQHNDFLPGIIEDELISIFTRLGTDMCAWHEAKHIIPEMNPELQKIAMAIIHAIPSQGFVNLHSARKYFDIMMQRTDEFVYTLEAELWRDLDNPVQPSLIQDNVSVLTSREDRANIFKKGLLHWYMAFKPLLGKAFKSGGNDILVAKALLLRFTCSSIALNCCFGPELVYDDYTTDFRKAFSLAETLSAAISSKTRPTFIISSVLIRSLYFIALKCRNKLVRTQAVACLKPMSRREGIWDSKVACTVAMAVMKLEGSDGDGFVLEHKRLRAVKTSFDLHKCEGKLRYLTAETDSGAIRFVAREVNLTW